MRKQKRIDNEKTAALLRAACTKRAINQQALAHKIGINQSQVSRLLRGKFKRRTKGLYALCTELDVKIAFTSTPFSLVKYPHLTACLTEVMDGSPARERAIVNLLRSARKLA